MPKALEHARGDELVDAVVFDQQHARVRQARLGRRFVGHCWGPSSRRQGRPSVRARPAAVSRRTGLVSQVATLQLISGGRCLLAERAEGDSSECARARRRRAARAETPRRRASGSRAGSRRTACPCSPAARADSRPACADSAMSKRCLAVLQVVRDDAATGWRCRRRPARAGLSCWPPAQPACASVPPAAGTR